MSAKKRRETYRRTLEDLAVAAHCGGEHFPRVLDFGCGAGWFVSRFAERGSRVVGVEVQGDSLREARKSSPANSALLVLYGGGTVPVRRATVDLVLAVGVVRSLMDRGPVRDAVAEWLRCLRPGGRLLLIETDNAAFRRYLLPEELKETIRGGGFESLSWYPIRKVGWWGLDLVKLGCIPRSVYGQMARWEIGARKRSRVRTGKYAYLGIFRKPM
jgi:SAM-dependent methyltransferase